MSVSLRFAHLPGLRGSVLHVRGQCGRRHMLLAVLLGSLLSPVQFVQGAEAAGTVKPAEQARTDDAVPGPDALPARRANPVDSPQKWTWVTVADHLNHPWGLAFLPEGGFLVTERSGALRRITGQRADHCRR